MAQGLKVFVNVDPLLDYDEPDDLPYAIYKAAANEIEEWLNDEIDYICDPPERIDLILGSEDPETVRTEAENWNKNIVADAAKKLELFLSAVNGEPGENLTERLLAADTASKNNYEMLRYNVRCALCSLDDRFIYGEWRMCIDSSENYGNSLSIRMPEAMAEDAAAHPENYAIVTIFYK